MRWYGKRTGDTRVVKRFPLFPVKANGEWRWLETCYIHQTWHGDRWNNDWFCGASLMNRTNRSIGAFRG